MHGNDGNFFSALLAHVARTQMHGVVGQTALDKGKVAIHTHVVEFEHLGRTANNCRPQLACRLPRLGVDATNEGDAYSQINIAHHLAVQHGVYIGNV